MGEYRLRVPGEGNGGQAHWVAVHLPECPQNHHGDINAAVCACPALRACEERVRRECALDEIRSSPAVEAQGYARGLDAARDAVDGMHLVAHSDDDFGTTWNRAIDTALEQVDALRDPAPTATAQDIADDRAEHVERDGGVL